MEITRIKEPKFKVGRYVLNECELRQLQLEVSQGLKPVGIVVKDLTNGKSSTIGESGKFNFTFGDDSGYSKSTKISLEMHKYSRIKNGEYPCNCGSGKYLKQCCGKMPEVYEKFIQVKLVNLGYFVCPCGSGKMNNNCCGIKK